MALRERQKKEDKPTRREKVPSSVKTAESSKVLQSIPVEEPDLQPSKPIIVEDESLAEEKPPVPELESEVEELTPLETEILDIAKKILKLKRYEIKLEIEREETVSPMVEKLYGTCVAKLTGAKGFSKSEIFLALRELERKNWIVTDERRTKEEILENDILQDVLKLISNDPGIHARDDKIQEVLGITRNPFTKHVMTLLRFDLIEKRKIGKTTNYFPRDFPEDLMELCVVLQNDLALDTVKLLIKDPNMGVLDLARELDVFHGAIQYHLKKMREFNFVDDDNKINFEIANRYNAITSYRKIMD